MMNRPLFAYFGIPQDLRVLALRRRIGTQNSPLAAHPSAADRELPEPDFPSD
jgi:hypothetical protein